MNLIRYYNQNRKKVWGILIIIASAFLLLQLVNYFYKIQMEEERQKGNQEQVEIEDNISTAHTKVTDNKSVVSGEELSNNQLKTQTTVIDEFVLHCNNKELEEAYNMLTNKCKEQMYKTLEIFEQAYYNDVFNGEKRICSVENWVNNTYKVRITEDMLETGKSNNGYAKQDYITIEEQDGEYKLNINNYIGYKEINQTTKQDDIQMEVVSKNTYMDYEEYTIKVTNLSKKEILLDQRVDAKSLYLEDTNGTKHSSYAHELTEAKLTIPAGQTKKIKIKFYNQFVSTKKIKYIVFSDIVVRNDGKNEKTKFRAEV